MGQLIALTRPVPDSLASCELTHLARVPIDPAVARAQHAAYEQALRSLGCDVRHLPAAPEHPDSVFVEDVAIVLDEIAVIARPGAVTRRGETSAAAQALNAYRRVECIAAPGTLDGGDVLRLGRTLYVGIGGRSNEEGAAGLDAIVRRFGYDVRPVVTHGCLHLKSAATEAGPGVVLINPSWVQADVFAGCRIVDVDPDEPHAANVLRVGDSVLAASAYDRTNARLESEGVRVLRLDVSELAKAEAGVTCCSLIFHA